MAKLARLQEEIYLGEKVIVVHEKPHKATKKFVKMFTGLIYEGFKQKTDDDKVTGFIELILTEKPFEALKIFVPELTEEDFDEATNRELFEAFKVVFKVNGLDISKLTKNSSALLSQVTKYTV